MFDLWNRIFSTENPRASAGTLERIGESDVDRRIGEEILREKSSRRALVTKIRDRMAYLKRDELPELVDRMLARFALYVVDLPASEKDHHSGPFGLLDHSLEVASETAAGLAGSSFRISADPLADYKERPAWVYAGMIAALAHDLGKVLDIEVTVQGRTWEPTRESLAAFLVRMGLSRGGPERWTFRPGRGLKGNEERNAELLGLILAPSASAYLGPCLGWIGKLFTCHTQEQAQRLLPEAARRIKDLVGMIDRGTSLEDAFERRSKTPARGNKAQASPGQRPEIPATAHPAANTTADTALPPPQTKVEPPAAPPQTPSRVPSPDHVPAGGEEQESPVPGRDPVEAKRLIDHELEPVNLLGAIRRMIQTCYLLSNAKYSLSFVTHERTWLIIPRGLERLAKFLHLRWNQDTERRMLASLQSSPQVDRTEDGGIIWRMIPHPKDTFHSAISISTQGFLSKADVERLKEWHFEIAFRSRGGEGDEIPESLLAS